MGNIGIALFIKDETGAHAGYVLGDRDVNILRPDSFAGQWTSDDAVSPDLYITFNKPGPHRYAILAGSASTLRKLFESGLKEIERIEAEG